MMMIMVMILMMIMNDIVVVDGNDDDGYEGMDDLSRIDDVYIYCTYDTNIQVAYIL